MSFKLLATKLRSDSVILILNLVFLFTLLVSISLTNNLIIGVHDKKKSFIAISQYINDLIKCKIRMILISIVRLSQGNLTNLMKTFKNHKKLCEKIW